MERLKVLGPISVGLLKNPENYKQAASWLTQQFPDIAGKMPATYEEALPYIKQTASVYQQMNPVKNTWVGTSQVDQYGNPTGVTLPKESVPGDIPMNVREWQYFNGLPESQKQQYLSMKRADKTLDIGGAIIQTTPGQPGVIAAQYDKTLAPSDQPANIAEKTRTIETEKATASLKASYPKAKATLSSLNRQWDSVDNSIDKALSDISPYTAGVGAWLAVIPASKAKTVSETLKTIKANIGFDKLQDMRANSPTGGALGQVSDMENRLLQAVQGSLEQTLAPSELIANLNNIKSILAKMRADKAQAFAQDFSSISQDQSQTEQTISPEARAYLQSLGI